MILLLKVSSGQKADKINAKWAAVVVNFMWLMATQRKTARRRHKGYVPHANLRLRKLPPYNSFCILPNLYRRWKWQITQAFTPHSDTNVFLCPALNNTGPSATELWPRMYGRVPRAPHPSPGPDDGFGVTLAIQPGTPRGLLSARDLWETSGFSKARPGNFCPTFKGTSSLQPCPLPVPTEIPYFVKDIKLISRVSALPRPGHNLTDATLAPRGAPSRLGRA